MYRRIIFAIAFLPLFVGCATTPPSRPENLCDIFDEKPDWHNSALKAKERWGIPVHVPMAMMYQESSFRHDAKPPRDYLLGFIPWGRVSSAYGYAQALDGTWAEYKSQAGSVLSSRSSFDDAMDFMGWYMHLTHQQNGISKWDAYNQYLAYHEGRAGWRRKTFNKKPWLKRTAQTVKSRADRFSKQYASCQSRLSRGGWLW